MEENSGKDQVVVQSSTAGLTDLATLRRIAVAPMMEQGRHFQKLIVISTGYQRLFFHVAPCRTGKKVWYCALLSVTDQQDSWVKEQINAGHFGNASEVVRERQTRAGIYH